MSEVSFHVVAPFRLVLICLGERTHLDSPDQTNDAQPKAGTVVGLIRIRSCGHSLTIRQNQMNRLTLVIAIIILLLSSAAMRAQSVARVYQSTSEATADDAKAIAALKRLEKDVIVYRTLADFQESGKLARVSLKTFQQELSEVIREVQPIIVRMPASKLKNKLTNALDSFRDGAYWWRQVDQPRVVNVYALASTEVSRSSADAAFLETAPYTVAINWRQAHDYLTQAEMLAR